MTDRLEELLGQLEEEEEQEEWLHGQGFLPVSLWTYGTGKAETEGIAARQSDGLPEKAREGESLAEERRGSTPYGSPAPLRRDAEEQVRLWADQGTTVQSELEGTQNRAGEDDLYQRYSRRERSVLALYHKVRRATSPGMESFFQPSALTAAEQEAASPLMLTVDELDQAVRRDSRRFDGAMSIY